MVDTGGYVPNSGCSDDRVTGNPNTILFDALSDDVMSPPFAVAVNEPIVICAYGLPAGAEITIYGISLASKSMDNGIGCCNTPVGRPGTPVINFMSPMTLGGHLWKITEDNTRLFINLPGRYVAILNDESYLTEFQAEYYKTPKLNAPIPSEYVAGVL